jgi:hypothetical protein
MGDRMTNASIIGHPLFQLNLMILLSRPSPAGSKGPIRPIFYEAGYGLSYIEKDIDVPPRSYQRLISNGPRVNRQVQPDLFLEHLTTRIFLPIECKRSDASISTGQLLGLLTLNGTDLAQVIGKTAGEVWETFVAYLSVAGSGTHIWHEMSRVAGIISSHGLTPADGVALELLQQSDGIYLTLAQGSPSVPQLNLDDPILVFALQPSEDPRPFYLIPFLANEGSEADPEAEECLREALRAAILVLMGKLDDEPQENDLDFVIGKAIPVWSI